MARDAKPGRLRRLVVLGVAGTLIAGVLAGTTAYWWINRPLTLSHPVELEVTPGEPPRDIAKAVADAGVDVSPWWLYQWFRWSRQSRQIRAGSYEITPETTPRSLLQRLIDGDQTLARLRLIEGWTFRQVRAELARTPALKSDTSAMSDAELMDALGATGIAPEGRFFPDTYTFAKGSSDLAVLKRAYQSMRKRLDAAWALRGPDSPLKGADELLTLASIVEKETGKADDRPMVAAVFVNRLRQGMPLQTDPTVIYGLGDHFDGNLRRKDLQTDTPYNTYTRAGLPPTPIALPGRDSLIAAVRPASIKALYFVARGDGTSQFSDTLAEHNRAVDKYQRKGAH